MEYYLGNIQVDLCLYPINLDQTIAKAIIFNSPALNFVK